MGMISAPVPYDCWSGCCSKLESEEDETIPSRLTGVSDPLDWFSGEEIFIESCANSKSADVFVSIFEETLVESRVISEVYAVRLEAR